MYLYFLVYLESDPNCVDLAFLLKSTGVGNSKKTPTFSIRITQVSQHHILSRQQSYVILFFSNSMIAASKI